MADSLIAAIMCRQDMTKEEAIAEIAYLAERVAEGENPESLLYDLGLEPDYVFDLIEAI